MGLRPLEDSRLKPLHVCHMIIRCHFVYRCQHVLCCWSIALCMRSFRNTFGIAVGLFSKLSVAHLVGAQARRVGFLYWVLRATFWASQRFLGFRECFSLNSISTQASGVVGRATSNKRLFYQVSQRLDIVLGQQHFTQNQRVLNSANMLLVCTFFGV